MKSQREKLVDLISEKDGLVLMKDATIIGISREMISIFVKENLLERYERGVYISPDVFDDRLFIIQSRSEYIIFSHDTALYLHGLTDRDPIEVAITVPSGYNASRFKKSGLIVYYIDKELHNLGVIEVDSQYGRKILIYNKERTICDILRNRSSMDIDIINKAIKEYVKSNEKNISLLISYSKKLRIENVLRNYLEVLL